MIKTGCIHSTLNVAKIPPAPAVVELLRIFSS